MFNFCLRCARVPESEQARDLYLQHWTSHAPMGELKPIVKLAERVGYVNRALTWKMSLADMPEALKAEYAIAVPSYLRDFINGVDCVLSA